MRWRHAAALGGWLRGRPLCAGAAETRSAPAAGALTACGCAHWDAVTGTVSCDQERHYAVVPGRVGSEAQCRSRNSDNGGVCGGRTGRAHKCNRPGDWRGGCSYPVTHRRGCQCTVDGGRRRGRSQEERHHRGRRRGGCGHHPTAARGSHECVDGDCRGGGARHSRAGGGGVLASAPRRRPRVGAHLLGRLCIPRWGAVPPVLYGKL